jgi:putative transposase
MEDIYRRNRYKRTVGWSTWHLQWCTKYRYKIFSKKEYRDYCKILIYEIGKRKDFDIIDCEVDYDHVHVIVSLPLTMTPIEALNYIKGYTSRCLFELIPFFRIYYKKHHLWSPGKFVGSIGHITLDKAKNYLQDHHAKSESQLFCVAKKLPIGQSFRAGRMSIFYIIFII